MSIRLRLEDSNSIRRFIAYARRAWRAIVDAVTSVPEDIATDLRRQAPKLQAELRRAMPMQTGKLRRSVRVKVRGLATFVEVGDPAAPHIRYRRGTGKWGAYRVDQTIGAWYGRALRPAYDNAIDYAYRRFRSRLQGVR